MKNVYFIFFLSLFCFESKAKQETHYKQLTNIRQVVVSQDSVRIIDSLALAKQDREVAMSRKFLFGSLGTLSLLYLLNFILLVGAGILIFLGLFLIFLFILLLRKRKPKSYEKLKKRAARRKNLNFLKKSWIATFVFGAIISLLGFWILGDYSGLYNINDVITNVLAPLYLFLIPVNLLIFFTGFFTNYDSLKQTARRFLLAISGLILSVLPIIIAIITQDRSR